MPPYRNHPDGTRRGTKSSAKVKDSLIRVLVFSKTPILGSVKTRMRPQLSDQDCLKLHEGLLAHTIKRVVGWQLPVRTVLYLTSTFESDHSALVKLTAEMDVPIEWQCGGNLGERMCDALESQWSMGFRKILIIGCDSPLLERRDACSAIEALDDHQVVLGPALDGGYYLIGFSSPHACAFSNVAWGTSNVYAQTVHNLETNLVSWSQLRVIRDLDTFEDLISLHREMHQRQHLNLRDKELLRQIDLLVQNRTDWYEMKKG